MEINLKLLGKQRVLEVLNSILHNYKAEKNLLLEKIVTYEQRSDEWDKLFTKLAAISREIRLVEDRISVVNQIGRVP